jgi:asparagine synthase (glutamine-hydrolysing)
MCGIYLTNIEYSRSVVEDKMNLIKFRGPDDFGYLKIGEITMAHLRLAILDLDKRSNQPFCFESYTITYNGEIYNYKEIKEDLCNIGYNFETESDTEVLIKGYAAWGSSVLDKLNGMFAFAIYDSEANTVFCGRDRLGVKPFYYYYNDGKFEICSQLSPLITGESELNEEAISIYLDCGYIPSPFSILKNVSKLPPGNSLLIDLNNQIISMCVYWDLAEVKSLNLTYEEAKDHLHDLLKSAVKIRMNADQPIGCFLSGGIDSALIASIATMESKKQIQTFTVGLESNFHDESSKAKEYSEIIGSEHNLINCKVQDILNLIPKISVFYDEPFADSSALPSLLLCKMTKSQITVALSGDGGDESFFGYDHFNFLGKFVKLNLVPYFIRKLILKFGLYKHVSRFRPETLEKILKIKKLLDFNWNIFTGFNELQKTKYKEYRKYYTKYEKLSKNPYQALADINIKLWLENDSNVKVDRASMGFSMEVRSPFLDYRVIEFARSLPVEFRFDARNRKRILKDILETYIPREVFNSPKKGFDIPLGNWMRNELKEEILNTLNNEFLVSIKNLDIDKFRSQIELHMKGYYDYSFNIWKLYVLAMWLDSYKNRKLTISNIF